MRVSKLEEIKDRLNQLLPTTKYEISDYKEEVFKWASNYQNDIQYLLSRLEIADKALDITIRELDNMWLDDDIGLLQSQIDNLNKAKEALQQIRGG